jgi:tight adherence protein B
MMSAAITAGAVLCWPTAPAARRLRVLTDQRHQRRTWQTITRRVPSPLIPIGIAAGLALPLAGPGVAVTIAVGGTTIRALWRSHQRTTSQLAAVDAMADGVHGLVAELRSGAHPVAAAESAAKDAREPARAVLTAIAATARLGGDLTVSMPTFATDSPALAPALRPLAHAWSLAQRHGLPLAEVLDAVRRDVAGRVRFAHRVRATMAGPRASGTVLAVLPLLGVVLGEGMGAHPAQVLLTTPLGQTLLAAGTTLISAGLYWITHLTTRAVLP